jgi:two-component system response regulator ResD
MEQRAQVTVCSLAIDRQRRSVQIGDQPIRLTPTEFALLWTLATHSGEVCRREELMQRVWGEGIHVTPRTVDVHMSKLRQKLRASDDGLSLVETVWGIGYRLRG